MSAPSFVHLRLHTEFSIVDSTLRVGDTVGLAAKDDQAALAITDLSNLFGFVKFYKAARAKGIKPICGVDAWIEATDPSQEPARVIFLAESHAGYLKLCDWLTRAFRDNQQRGRAMIKREWIADAALTEGVFCLSGGWFGDAGFALRNGQTATAERTVKFWSAAFPGRFAMEIHRAGFENEHRFIEDSVALATKCGIPLVATHPMQFATTDDYKAHEARVCIAEGYTLGDTRRPKVFTEKQRFVTQAEMVAKFADFPQAIANTMLVAMRCNLALTLGKNFLPNFPLPEGATVESYLHAEVMTGLEKRLAVLYPDEAQRDAERPRYVARSEFEIGVILKMGFPGYFLIVADFIAWAKNNGVPVGPGRGSGAGSLVAYSLGITDLDPLKYNLLFERFLNPERVSMPDFDIDFCQEGRDRVIDYVRKKYGTDSVGQIATFGTMAAKAAVRDCGRVLDMPYTFVDGVAKLIPFAPGKWITLTRPNPGAKLDANTIVARDAEPLLAERERTEEDVAALLELAEQVEGLPRNVGMHAGGVIIAPGKLTDFCPMYSQDEGSPMVSQFDKDDVEAIGLVKFDFLGLTTLTILDWTVRFCKRLDPTFEINLQTLPLDDASVYQLFREANTVAIFQFESSGMKDLLTKSKPQRLEDLTALNALYRPGPMDLIPDYIARRNGTQTAEFYDDRLKPMLEETLGIMVYQEQVMQAAQIIGGYSLGGADLLRRAMGKKKPEEMAAHRVTFNAGAAKNGLDEKQSNVLFSDMEKFAGYGFNKSHSAAYALLAYQTAYFKRHHAAAFMAANMSAVMNDTDKVRQLLEDSRTVCALVFEPPDVNLGEYRFVPTDRKTIRYGLGAVKGTGEGAVIEILRARAEGGPFVDLFDFCRRVNTQTVNRRTVEALIKGGAFDRLHDNRASAFASVASALSEAERAQANISQNSLFGDDSGVHHVPLIDARPWQLLESLAFEKAALGLYLSGHPYDAYRAHLQPVTTMSLARIEPSDNKQRLSGIVNAVRMINSRNGRMCFIELDDRTAVRELMLPAAIFEMHRHWIKEDIPIVIEARVTNGRDGGTRVIADAIYDIEKAREQFSRRLVVTLNGTSASSEATALLATLKAYRPGRTPVFIKVNKKGYSGGIALGEEWCVRPHSDLLAKLNAELEF